MECVRKNCFSVKELQQSSIHVWDFAECLKSTAAAQFCVDAIKGSSMILERSQCKYKEGVWARDPYLAEQTGAAVLKVLHVPTAQVQEQNSHNFWNSWNPQNKILTVWHSGTKTQGGTYGEIVQPEA